MSITTASAGCSDLAGKCSHRDEAKFRAYSAIWPKATCITD